MHAKVPELIINDLKINTHKKNFSEIIKNNFIKYNSVNL